MHYLILATAIFAMAQARPGLLFAQPAAFQPLGVQYASLESAVHPHPAVELNAANEALLPRALLKSRDFYDDPHVAAGLAKESWFTNKEMQVVEREAEKIPRQSIYEIVKHAGFLERH